VHIAGREITSDGELRSRERGCERSLGGQEGSRRVPEPVKPESFFFSGLSLAVRRKGSQQMKSSPADETLGAGHQPLQGQHPGGACCGGLGRSLAPSLLPRPLPDDEQVRNHTGERRVWLLLSCGCFVVTASFF